MAGKTVIGFREYVTILCGNKARKAVARIDTGASKCSIDIQLAKSLGLGPVLRQKKVKSAHGTSTRDVILARIVIGKRRFRVFFNLADRKHLKYSVLIGRNLLKRGFVIDSSKGLG